MLYKKIITLAIPILLCTFIACKKKANEEVQKELTTADKLQTIEGKHVLKGAIYKTTSDRQGLHTTSDTTYIDNYEVSFTVSANNELTMHYNNGAYTMDKMEVDTKYKGSINLQYYKIGGGYFKIILDYNTNTSMIEKLETESFYQKLNEHTTTTTIVSTP